jgi:hypothetical protein
MWPRAFGFSSFPAILRIGHGIRSSNNGATVVLALLPCAAGHGGAVTFSLITLTSWELNE